VPVAGHDVGAADDNFANRIRRLPDAVEAADAYLHSDRRPTAGSRLGHVEDLLLVREERRDGRRLGGAVDVKHLRRREGGVGSAVKKSPATGSWGRSSGKSAGEPASSAS